MIDRAASRPPFRQAERSLPGRDTTNAITTTATTGDDCRLDVVT